MTFDELVELTEHLASMTVKERVQFFTIEERSRRRHRARSSRHARNHGSDSDRYPQRSICRAPRWNSRKPHLTW